jgi:hypothetical protein
MQKVITIGSVYNKSEGGGSGVGKRGIGGVDRYQERANAMNNRIQRGLGMGAMGQVDSAPITGTPSSQYTQSTAQPGSTYSQASPSAGATSQATSQASYSVGATGGSAAAGIGASISSALSGGTPVMTWGQIGGWAVWIGVVSYAVVKLRERGTI